ncbi:L-ascorbate oxidase homolog [Elaeis guineensis]|uniref:L-ascorbate oxidase homolog n=1 Tax=Elaeis guineensis var. tenera TaxID=51953 RepID=UPI003C6D8FA3
MGKTTLLVSFVCLLSVLPSLPVRGEDPYRFFTWNIAYGDIWPLGVKQQVLLYLIFSFLGILINGQFPGPQIEAVTNDNIIINVFNNLPEPFLLSWSIFLLQANFFVRCSCQKNSDVWSLKYLHRNGVLQRKNCWQDGVYGTNCPIPPGQNFTYALQVKDQIGSYFYFPSLAFHKAAGGFGGFRILSRPLIPVPFPPPAADYTLLIGDWYKTNHYGLKGVLDGGKNLPFPDGVLINGRGWNGNNFTVEQGSPHLLLVGKIAVSYSA